MSLLARIIDPTSTMSATVTRVVDGDTIRADVTLGMLSLGTQVLAVIAKDEPIRLRGCNAAEKNTDAGKAARAHLIERLPVGTLLHLAHVEDYKFGGELVADVTVLPHGANLVAELIAQQCGECHPRDAQQRRRPCQEGGRRP